MTFRRLEARVGPAAGGILLAIGGLPLTSAIDAGSFALVLGVLLIMRPPYEPDPEREVREPVHHHLVQGIATAGRAPGIRAMLLTVVGLAVTVRPLVMLCLPVAGPVSVAARSRPDSGCRCRVWLLAAILALTTLAAVAAERTSAERDPMPAPMSAETGVG